MINRSIVILLLFSAIFYPQLSSAKIRLPMLLSDSMVIQRDAKIKIWGWADSGEKISIKFKGKNYATTTGANGKWLVWLPPTKAGGPYNMDITGDGDNITLRNILVGDVWMCAGQSNMVHYMALHSERYEKEIAEANCPEIRQFLVSTNPKLEGPAEDISNGSWKGATSKDILHFSVVAYFFAKKLYEQYKVPIGIINTSVGGTPIEAWTSEEALKGFPDLLKTIVRNKDTAYVNRVNRVASEKRQAIMKQRPQDEGLTGPKPWYAPAFTPERWHTINIPGYWEDQGIRDLDGVVWYRREIDVPPSMTGIPAKIAMGRIVDADFVYINGTLAGKTTYQYPQRRYEVPAGVLKPGKNIMVVRVINQYGKGGFVPDKPYYLAAGGDTLDLKGYWQYKVGAVYDDQPGGAEGIAIQYQPTALFNGMVAPLTDFSIRGVVWYQGESNEDNPEAYAKLLPAFIRDWRNQWGENDLPFLYVQLPNYREEDYSPSESHWAVLREAQRKALQVPNTAMVVAIDLGEWNDVHPDNKRPIGERLALAARNKAYGEKDVVYSGPLYSSSTVTQNKVVLHFSHAGSGLISKDGEALKWFSVAGEDKKFVWANATIKNDDVVVWSENISDPVYVRYAWADNPDGVNLYNKEGLPASPFEAQVADPNRLWHGKKAAVVLTYDDALDVHLDNVIPLLDSLGLKGTFYLSAAFPGSKNRIEDWKHAAENGHELGNHTLFHPCDASKPGRSWVSPQDDLSHYTTEEIVREIAMTNIFLESLDGRKERTFAYPCGDTETGDGSYVDGIKDQFIAMRGVRPRLNQIGTLDLENLNCYAVDDSNVDQLVSWAEKARDENGLLILLFHGVGGGHNINVALKKHRDFLKYLKSHEDEYWVTTLLEAARHCIQRSKNGL
jgi:sialate O-acetylesterase